MFSSLQEEEKKNRLDRRSDLLRRLLINDKVYQNCSGFIRIFDDYESNYGYQRKLNPLDTTRIHPESYPVAYALCKYARNLNNKRVSLPFYLSVSHCIVFVF